MTNILKDSTIRNSFVCKDSSLYGHYTNFNKERDTNGWDFVENATLYGVSSGFYFLTSLGSNPSLARSNNFGNLDASVYTEVVLTLRYKKNEVGTNLSNTGSIQFTAGDDVSFSSDKAISFEVYPDDLWHTYTINAGVNQYWVGYITNLKINFSINGNIGDEVFLGGIKVQKHSFNVCSSLCSSTEDVTNLVRNYDTETVGVSPAGAITTNTDSERVIYVTTDPKIYNNKCVVLESVSTSNIGPTLSYQLNEPVNTGFMSTRFYVTNSGINISLKQSLANNKTCMELQVAGSAELNYSIGGAFGPFEEAAYINLNSWNDFLLAFRGDTRTYDVFLNGTKVGSDISYLTAGPIDGVQISNPISDINSIYIDELCIVSQQEISDCPGIGQRAEITGLEITESLLEVISGNNTLAVNIDDFGDVIIKIQPELYSITDIAHKLEEEIAALDVGGYAYVEVDVTEDRRILIRSGSYSFYSSVIISKDGNSTLAEQLGFVSSTGTPVYTSKGGRPHSRNFLPINYYRVRTSDLHKLKAGNSNSRALTFNPIESSIAVGQQSFYSAGSANKIDATNKTYIDFAYPATAEGYISEVYFRGRLNSTSVVKASGNNGLVVNNIFYTGLSNLKNYNVVNGDIITINADGYADNGSYEIEVYSNGGGLVKIKNNKSLVKGNDLSYTIHSLSKVKQLRPKLDGSYTVINEAVIGTMDGGKVYSRKPEVFKASVDWYIHRGDVLGIYNAKHIYVGNDINGDNSSIYLYADGDLYSASRENLILEGKGFNGVGLFGTNNILQNSAIIDIKLEYPTYVDNIIGIGSEETSNIEYNLLTAINNGISLSMEVSGTHHHTYENLNGDILGEDHENIAHNVHALTDGVKYASDGLLVSFEEDAADAVYFYVTGDGEFADTLYDLDSNILDVSKEYPNFIHYYITEYNDDPFAMVLSWGIKKTINKFKAYFKEYPNIRSFYLQWLKDPSKMFDGDRAGFEKIGHGNTNEFVTVTLDSDIVPSGNAEATLLNKQFETIFDSSPMSINSIETSQYFDYMFPYTILEKEFDPVTTTSIIWKWLYHESTKISEVELYCPLVSKAALDSSIELFYSTDGSTFYKADYESVDENTLKLKVGIPIQYIRVFITPETTLTLNSLESDEENIFVEYKKASTDEDVGIVDLQVEKGGFSKEEHLKIRNRTGEAADILIDLDFEDLNDFVVLKSTLNSEEDILEPEIGPPGQLHLEKDFDFPITENVALNIESFSLKNVAAGKSFYISNFSDIETDLFIENVDIDRWINDYTNFPQASPCNLGLKFPGFGIEKVLSTYTPPVYPITAELTSRWYALGSFTASILASYDARGSNADGMESGIGIVDESGRKLYIRKVRKMYNAGFAGLTNFAKYEIVDSLTGVISSYSSFCLGTTCVGDTFGTQDDEQEYKLYVSREIKSGSDTLSFYIIDSVNGTGSEQWLSTSKLDIDLSSLETPLIGNVKIFIYNCWRKSSSYATGTPGAAGSYIKIHNFIFGGLTNYDRKLLFDSPSVVGDLGEVLITNESPERAFPKVIAIDLGELYELEIQRIDLVTSGHENSWNIYSSIYSNSQTSNIEDVVWGNSTSKEARWVALSEIPAAYGAPSLKYLDSIKLYPSIHRNNVHNNLHYEALGTILGDGDKSTKISNKEHSVVVVRLDEAFELETFEALDSTLSIPTSSDSYTGDGWLGSNFYYAYSSDRVEDPEFVETWTDWEVCSGISKILTSPVKWIAFKSKEYTEDALRYISNIKASTKGLDSSEEAGIYLDRIDCTEYSTWFRVNYFEELDISTITDWGFSYLDGEAFSGTIVSKSVAESETSALNAFDGNSSTYSILQPAPGANLWRIFGDVVVTSSTVLAEVSGVNLYTTTYSYEYDKKEMEVSGLTFYLGENTAAIPDTIVIEKLVGADPTLDDSWDEITRSENLAKVKYLYNTDTSDGATYKTLDNLSTEYVFNDGDPLTIRFSESITTSGIRVRIASAEALDTTYPFISISNIVIFQDSSKNAEDIISIESDCINKVNGRSSLKLVYSKNYTGSASVVLGSNTEFDLDTKYGIQDYYGMYLKGYNTDKLDLDNSFIRLGKNSREYYQWNLDSNISNQLELHKFKFKDAEYINDDLEEDSSNYSYYKDRRLDLKTDKITYLELVLKPSGVLIEDISIWVDNPKIVREDFNLQGKYNKTLYLNNQEYLCHSLSEFDIREGHIECIITPDWDSHGVVDYSRNNVFILFNIVNELGETFLCFYKEFEGLTFIADSIDGVSVMQVGEIAGVTRGVPFKLAFSWLFNTNARKQSRKPSLQVWINDLFICDFKDSVDLKKSNMCKVYIGGSTYLSNLTRYLTEIEFTQSVLNSKANSVCGGVENLIISSKGYKVEYANLQSLKDKIYLSIDGINYYNRLDGVLPITIYNVAPEEEIDIWVKVYLPKDTKNLARMGYIKTRWRLID